MVRPDTAKPATAETVNGLRIVEQLRGRLDLENALSDDISTGNSFGSCMAKGCAQEGGAHDLPTRTGIGP